MQLRNYQEQLLIDSDKALSTARRVLAVLSTGGGKTVVFSTKIKNHEGAACVIVHKREIIRQISCALARVGVRHRIVAPEQLVRSIRKRHLQLFDTSFIDQSSIVGVCSVQTLIGRGTLSNEKTMAWVSQITLAVLDEAHHYVNTGSWAKALNLLERADIFGVTATPERADGKGLGSHASGFADVMVEGPPMSWLIDNGYLSPIKYYAPASDLNIDDVPITASGDVNSIEMRKRVVSSSLVGDVVQQYLKYSKGKRALVFVESVATADEVAHRFTEAGVTAVSVSGNSTDAHRDTAMDDFEAGKVSVLVNVDLFDEGVDVPAVEAVVLARVTFSLSKFLQQIGRVLRVCPGKQHGIVIDVVRNWERHGAPTWPRRWTLDDQEASSKRSGDDTVAQKLCESCTQPYEAFYKACPYCLHEPVPADRKLPVQVDGDLFELDLDSMNALFKKIDDANMSRAEYENVLASNRVPQIGRLRLHRLHEEAKHCRSILMALIEWWMESHPAGRSLSEKQRRFFHFFGIDVATAQTLNAKETRSLIDLIQRKYTESIKL